MQDKLVKSILKDIDKQNNLTINGYMIFNVDLQEMIKSKLNDVTKMLVTKLENLEKLLEK